MLVSIHSKSENDFIVKRMAEIAHYPGGAYNFWIGLIQDDDVSSTVTGGISLCICRYKNLPNERSSVDRLFGKENVKL